MPHTSQASESGDFEELLMRPAEVIGQSDDTSGCGAACLVMILGLEHRGAVDPGMPRGGCPFPQRLEAAHPEDAPFVWSCRPSTLVEAINRHGGTGPPRALGPRQYHVVHGAAPNDLLDEISTWLRGWPTMEGPLRLPSALLVHHGTHWMLAVGARVESGALEWMALADPATESLICVTPDGLRDVFTPNTIGSHPDWFGRHVAVIPCFLPRPCERPSLEASIPRAVKPITAPRPPMPATRPPASRLSPTDESPLLEAVHRWVGTAYHPIVQSWLGPLATARTIVTDHFPPSGVTPMATGSSRRSAHVLDANGTALAILRYRTNPLTLLECRVHPAPDPTRPKHAQV